MKKLKKLIINIILGVLLVDSGLTTFGNFTSEAYETSSIQNEIQDTEGPIINSMSINTNEVTAGDEVIITLDVTDVSGVKSANGILSSNSDSDNKGVTFVKQEDGSFVAKINITKEWVDGIYNLYFIQAYDNNDNKSYINSESYSHPILGKIYINVSGCTSDTEGPIINSMSINTNEVTAGDEIIITLDVNDISGVKSASGILSPNNNSGNKGVTFVKQENGSFVAKINITNKWQCGIYNLYYIEAYDNNGNKSYINSGSYSHPILGKIYFNVCVKDHNYDEGNIIRNATCSNEGEILYTCQLCKKTKNELIPIDKSNHSLGIEHYVDSSSIRATTTINKNVYIDKECILSIYGNVVINGDVYVLGNLTVYGTLTIHGTLNGLHYNNSILAGDYSYSYIKNSGTLNADTLNINDDFLSLTYDEINEGYKCTQKREATCSTDGEIIYECISCHEQKKEIISSLGHSWDEGIVTTTPKCEIKGVKTFECTICHETRIEDIEELGHNYLTQWNIDKKATCTETGWKSRHCTRCSAVTDLTEITVTEHIEGTPVKENEIESTVEKEGSYDEVVYCMECNKELKRVRKTIPKEGVIIGDINEDGKINTLDAVRILQYVAKKVSLTDVQMLAADTSGDGKVNTLDAVRILQYVAKKITRF